jgi:hypothetical protein
MATTIRVDSFHPINIVERSELLADYVAGSLTLELSSTQGFTDGQVIYVGHLSREGNERAVVATVDGETTVTLSEALKGAHARYEAVTAVLGDSIHIYRAVDVDGSVPAAASFTVLATRLIDPDQPSTYYRDSTGSSAFWYRHTYFNPLTNEETDLLAFDARRGDDFGHYASLNEIRKEAGFENATNLPDSDVELQRRNAESEINASLSGAYTVPFIPVPEIVRTLTIKLAAAMLLINAYGETGSSKAQLAMARNAIEAYKHRDVTLTDADGNSLANSDTVSGWPNDEPPRSFYIGQRF